MVRVCSCCLEEKLLAEEFFARRENGLFRFQCRSCINKKYNERQAIKLKEKREQKANKMKQDDLLFSQDKKICGNCNQILHISYFNKQKNGKYGLESCCKSCKSYLNEKRNNSKISYLKKCRVCGLEAKNSNDLSLFSKSIRNKFGRDNICLKCKNEKNKNDSVKYKEIKIFKKFGITKKEYDDMVLNQNNKCAICGKDKKDFNGIGNSFHVDHCHSTGKVRGLLCSNCNTGLGQFKDDIMSLENAIKYLKQFKSA